MKIKKFNENIDIIEIDKKILEDYLTSIIESVGKNNFYMYVHIGNLAEYDRDNYIKIVIDNAYSLVTSKYDIDDSGDDFRKTIDCFSKIIWEPDSIFNPLEEIEKVEKYLKIMQNLRSFERRVENLYKDSLEKIEFYFTKEKNMIANGFSGPFSIEIFIDFNKKISVIK